MNTPSSSCFAGLIRLISNVILAASLGASAFSADKAELEKLFKDYAESKRDDKAGKKLRVLKDDTVDFLCEVIKKQEPHPVEYLTLQGKERHMGTWSQEAGTLLMAIDTPKVVTEVRKLALDKSPEVRYWGVWVLQGCDTERKETLTFLRSRMEHESGRTLSDIVEHVAERLDSADVPAFQKLAASQKDRHVKLALWYALALQGDKNAAVEIAKVCEAGSGHLGVVYLGRVVSGQDFGPEMKKWREGLEKMSAEDFRKMTDRARPAPLPPPPAGQPALPVPEGTPDEVKEALVWSGVLGLPSVKNLTRVQVVDESTKKGAKDKTTKRHSGWLLEEKAGTWRIQTGPDAKDEFMWDAQGLWPLAEWTVQEYDKTRDDWRNVRRVEKTDFKKEAEAVLARLDDPAQEDWREGHGRVLPERVSVFLIGRDCLELGHTELALKLLHHATVLNRSARERRSLGQLLADDFALSALWKITLDFGEPAVSREALLMRLEDALKKFPSSGYAEKMKEMAERLRKMVEEDRTRAAAAKPFDTLTPEQQAEELVYQLRNQNGHQYMQPGGCDVFATGDRKEDSPAHRLLKMGHAAVPALIKALGDESYSRSVGFWRGFTFSHTILTVGDCALQVLHSIAGEAFYERKTTSSYMSRDDQAKATREAAEKWWEKVQKEGGGKKNELKTKGEK